MNATRIFKQGLMAVLSLFLIFAVSFAGNVKNKGTIVNASGQTMTVTGNLQNFNGTAGIVTNAGTLTITGNYVNGGAANGLTVNYIGGNAGTIDVTGAYTNSTGFTWNSLGGSTIKIGGAFSNTTANNFSTDTGKVVFKGAGQSIDNTIKLKTFGTLEIGTGATGTATLAGDSTYAGTLTLTAAQLNENGKVLVLNGSVTTGGGTLNAAAANSTTLYNAVGSQNVLASTYDKLSIKNNGLKSALGNITINNSLSTTSANDSLDFAAHTFNLAAGASVTGLGKLMASGTVTTNAVDPTIGGSFVYYGAGTAVANAKYTNLTLRTGSFTMPADTVSVAGAYTLEATPTVSYTSNTFAYNGTSAQTVQGGQTYNKVLLTGATDTSLANAKTVASTFTIAIGGGVQVLGNTTLDMGSNSITFLGANADSVQGSARIRWASSNVYLAGTGLTEFYGSGATTIAAGTYGYLWIDGTGTQTISGAVNVNGGSPTFASIGFTVDNNLTVNGTLTLNGPDLNNNGTLTNNGTVTVN